MKPSFLALRENSVVTHTAGRQKKQRLNDTLDFLLYRTSEGDEKKSGQKGKNRQKGDANHGKEHQGHFSEKENYTLICNSFNIKTTLSEEQLK